MGKNVLAGRCDVHREVPNSESKSETLSLHLSNVVKVINDFKARSRNEIIFEHFSMTYTAQNIIYWLIQNILFFYKVKTLYELSVASRSISPIRPTLPLPTIRGEADINYRSAEIWNGVQSPNILHIFWLFSIVLLYDDCTN